MDTYAWDLLDADDKANILKGLTAGKAFGPPRLIDLEWSRRQFLPDGASGRPPGLAADEMDLYTIERLFEEMEGAGVKGLVLGGAGEPLGHRSIDSILKRCARMHFRLCALSTGGASAGHRTLELLAALRPRTVEFRMEAMDEVGTGGPSGASGERLRLFRSLLPAGPDCRVVARRVLFPGDELKIARMAAEAVDAGADTVDFAVSRRLGEALAAVDRRRVLFRGVRAALDADREGRIEFVDAPLPGMDGDPRASLEDPPGRVPGTAWTGAVDALFRTACVFPWLGLAVAPNGAAHPCRRAMERGEPPAGSIHALSLARLWRSRPMKALRRGSRGPRWGGRCCPACRPGEDRPLPYAGDRAFRQELDSLMRGGSERAVRFPERLRDREWSTVVLPLRHLWSWRGEVRPQVRVDGVPVGAAANADGSVAIRFRPDGLPRGFHLVEVVDPSGRLLGARLVEKTGG